MLSSRKTPEMVFFCYKEKRCRNGKDSTAKFNADWKYNILCDSYFYWLDSVTAFDKKADTKGN
ncbi:hypothetical protein KLL42_05725 [Clostridioides difficile]|nr:hypothetical protein [Clostridioides difficile]